MGFIKDQLSNVVEWSDQREGQLFWKWQNDEIKKGSVLFIRPGQDAIFLYNGKCEGIFEDEGKYDIESQIIPFLSTLKGFKFGFNSGLRSEVLFINTLEQVVKWGTKNSINLPAPGLKGGMPIRAFGTFNCKIVDRDALIDKLAGIHQLYTIEDVKEPIIASLDQLLMAWIAKEGHDMFNLQVDARNIAEGIRGELDAEMREYGIGITKFTIESFNYPEEIRKMQETAAAQSMVEDVNKYAQFAMADSMKNGKGGNGGGMAADMVSMQMGMAMGQQMVQQMNMGYAQPMMQQPQMQQPQMQAATPGAKFCPNCGTPTNGAKFCSNCGTQLA